MNNRTVGIVLTIVTVMFCALPGLAMLCLAPLGVLGLYQQGDLMGMGNSDRASTLIVIVLMLCVGVVGVMIPILVGVLAFRKKSAPAVVVDINEPIPPPA